MGIRGILGRGILAAFIARGAWGVGVDTGNVAHDNTQNSSIELNTYYPEATNEIALSSEKKSDMKIQKETIERKYNINLYTMKEAFAIMGREYDDQNPELVGQAPPVRWREDQLQLISDFLPLLPKNLLNSIDGKKLGIALSDFGTDCECAGVSYNKTGLIGVGNFNSQDREGFFSLLAHELTHRWDALNNNIMANKIKKILGDKFSIDSKELIDTADSDPDRGAAISTVKQIHEGKFTEPIANISQFYVRGYDRFMNALGPLLDGNGYPDNIPTKSIEPSSTPDISSYTDESTINPSPKPEQKDLSVLYPKTKALYDLYKSEVFQGKEYDFSLLQKIEHSPNEQKIIDTAKIFLEAMYCVEISTDSGKQIESKSMQFLSAVLKSFPKSFYSVYGDQKLKIVLTDSVDKLSSHAENTLFLPSVPRSWSNGEPNRYASALFHELIVDNDNATNNKFSNTLIQILGGEKFLKSPEKLYPELKNRNNASLVLNFPAYSIFYDIYGNDRVQSQSEIAAKIGDFYLGGWKKIVMSLGPIVDPKFGDYDKWMNNRVDHSNTKLAKIYEAFMQFTGVEFNGSFNNGAPLNFGINEK